MTSAALYGAPTQGLGSTVTLRSRTGLALVAADRRELQPPRRRCGRPPAGHPESVVVKSARNCVTGVRGRVTGAISGASVSHGVAARQRRINQKVTVPSLTLPAAGPCDRGTQRGVKKAGGAESQGRMDQRADCRPMVDKWLTARLWIGIGHDTERAFARRPDIERAPRRRGHSERTSCCGRDSERSLRRTCLLRRRHCGWRPARSKRDGP